MQKGGKREGSGRKLISGKDIKVKLPFDLIYEINNKIDGFTTAEKVRNALVSHLKEISTKKYSVIDLFCGVGGFSYGFEMNNNFDVVLGADIWDVALKTFSINHHATTLIKDDIRDIDIGFRENLANKIDIIIAGPPCQGFSMAGKRDINDKRNTLFEEVVKIANVLQPKFVILENVVGLLSMTNTKGELIKDIIVQTIVPSISLVLLIVIFIYVILKKATDNIKQENKEVKKITENSINIDTSIIYKEMDLSKIKEADNIKTTLFEMYKELIKAYTNFDKKKIETLTSKTLYNHYLELLNNLEEKDEAEVYKNITLNDIRILSIRKNKTSATIKFYLNINCYNYKVDKKTKTTMRGFDYRKINQELLIFLVKKEEQCVINKIVKIGQKTLQKEKKNKKR